MNHPYLARTLLPLIVFLGTQVSRAAVVTPGNLLVAENATGTITEYTTSGTFVQRYLVSGGDNNLRDLSADAFGNIHAFNGTSVSIGPVTLTTIDQVTGSQTDHGTVDFSTAGVVGYGGIAVLGDRVFVNDSATGGSPGNGLISFEIGNMLNSTRFATDFAANDLTAGMDGRLYALGIESTVTGLPARYVNVYDSQSLMRIEQIDLLGYNVPAGLRAITSDLDGNLYGVSNDDEIVKLDRSGNILDTLTVTASTAIPLRLVDIDISPDGTIAASSFFGRIFVTDTQFSGFTTFDAASEPLNIGYYVAFTTPISAVPEPGTSFALLLAVGWCTTRRRRHAGAVHVSR